MTRAARDTGARAAAVDIGTNSVLLLIAEREGAQLRAVLEQATVTRLGEQVDRTQRLNQAAIERTLTCLEQYGATCRTRGVEKLRAVGTSALRDAGGAEEFLGRAKAALGVQVEIISGVDEARLTARGALQGLSLTGELIVADIGGGSTELVYCKATQHTLELAHTCSLDVGSVRLFERHVTTDPPNDAALAAARQSVRSVLSDLPNPNDSTKLVGVAGTVTTLAAIEQRLSPYDGSKVHGAELSATSVHEMAIRLGKMTHEARLSVPGLLAARADVIVTGALLLDEILRFYSAPRVVVSDRGVRWGLASELLAVSAA